MECVYMYVCVVFGNTSWVAQCRMQVATSDADVSIFQFEKGNVKYED